jgi:hypothetical protein
MNWKLKAKIQNIIDLLPSSFSYAVYYWLQRYFGSLRGTSPVNDLCVAIELCKLIKKAGRSIIGKSFLEIGTGRTINIPLAFWLLGAKEIITVDINRYLKEELVMENIFYIRDNKKQIIELFEGNINNNRLDNMIEFSIGQWSLIDLLKFCNIKYLAPGDAAKLPLPSNSVDFHTSHAVLEHIAPDILKTILKEGNRVTKEVGLFIHRIDYSDHFSYSDPSISPINFLQFDDDEWDRIAGNRYMYMNRLRDDDFIELFKRSNQKILISETYIDASVKELLTTGSLKLNARFAGKVDDILAITGSWIVSEKCG